MVQKGFELDFAVAQDVGVWGAASRIFFQKHREHPVFVFAGEVHGFNVHAHYVGHAGSVQPVLPAGTIFRVVIVFPVFHEKTNHVVTLLL